MPYIRLWKRISFHHLLLLLHCFAFITCVEISQLPFCSPHSTQTSSRSLVFVSTLDGRISALDAADNGKKQWTLDFEKLPMLSSNIHRRELNNNGEWVRLIPSLRGGLYKFDGENLEPVPVTTDQLLRSSFRYSDDLVFSGGKETRSYGISSTTGKVLYECNIGGCTNNTENGNYLDQEVLVLQRFQQTIRAIEPRTGIERWNFSVGQNELILIPQENVDCHGQSSSTEPDFEIKVIVPEGLVWAVKKNNPAVKLWQFKFDSPIVSIWKEHGTKNTQTTNSLEEVDLFDSSQWKWGSEFVGSPSIYLGMHNKQLYVQENIDLYDQFQSKSSNSLRNPRIPWQPYPAIEHAVVHSISNVRSETDKQSTFYETEDAPSTTALSVLYNSEYINGNGFYLYTKKQLDVQNNNQCNTSIPDSEIDDDSSFNAEYEDENDTPVQVIIVSIWYWWKEILIISFTTAILLNCMLTQRLLNASVTKDAAFPPLIVERHVEVEKREPKISEGNDGDDFKSRYLTDFEPVDCLGRGGYGVVFEAKNKIDDCNYAIKRIALPNSSGSRERVMREVKALAKLDHHNIVRYFNAWLECPPAGWQEEHDQKWINNLKCQSLDFPSELLQTETKSNNCVCIDVSQTDQSSVDSALEAYELNNQSDDEDSFILFDKSNNEEHGMVINIDDGCSTQSSEVSLSNTKTKNSSFNINHSNKSESVVFQDNDVDQLCCNNKSKRKKRKKSYSIDMNNKINTIKSAKMFLYIQMQLCQRLSLREWLKQQENQRNSTRSLNIFQQIVDAVEYVHLQGLIHRDLKPSNIFFAYDDKIKIGDFGLVTAMTECCDETCNPAVLGDENESVVLKNSLHTARVGTHLYMPPEQMNGQIYNYKVDIYSLGIIFFELLIPFATEMERVVSLTNLRKSVFPNDFETKYPAEHKLLEMMLHENPDKRPTTLGIKARPPLSDSDTTNGLQVDDSRRWHFDLPPLTRHSSVTSSSSGESWENVS